jgi:hypothetical protein
MPLCALKHWILLDVYIRKKTFTIYNSLKSNEDSQKRYEAVHKIAIAWMRNFLSWRTGM